MKLERTNGLQRWLPAAQRIEIEPERLGQLKHGNPEVILGRNEQRILVRKGDLRLENVESRNSARFESILLILQLALEQIHR